MPRSRHSLDPDTSAPLSAKTAVTEKETKTGDTTQVTKKKQSASAGAESQSVINNPVANVYAGITTQLKNVGQFFFTRTDSWKKVFQRKHQQQNPKAAPVTKPKMVLPKPLRIILFPILNPYVRYSLLTLFLLFAAYVVYILRDLPSPSRLTSSENFAVSSQILDRKGRLLYEVFGDENRTPIKLKTLPPYVYQASIAIEDRYFYHHFGLDVIGTTRALRDTLAGKRLEGGSTITQQLVKNALLTPDRTIQRKIKEAILSVATELVYSKDEILEMYLNYISYGGTSVGIESASHRYFNKSAKDLDLAEAAMLAGLPQSPSRYSPFGSNPEEAKNRQQEVLRRMVEDHYITQQQADQAKNEVLKFAINDTQIQAPHFVFYVRDLLFEKYGEARVERGGLRVTTTLDLDLQNAAQASLSAEVAKLQSYKVGNGAALILKPNTGEILAMVGSKDYFDTKDDGQVNVTISPRQPGSSIKPIMYSTAFQMKLLNPGTFWLDIPTCFNEPGQKPYCPKNYDGTFHGPVSVRTALGNSLNIPAVKSLKLIGVQNFIDQATKMGITTWTNPANYGLSLTLGGGEVKMVDLAQAFSVLADEGVKVPLTPILKVEDYKGNVLESVDTQERKDDLQYLSDNEDEVSRDDLTRVMNRAPAYLVSHIMQDNNARTMAFGPHSKLIIPGQVVSVKTGTTNDLRDNWTVGFTPDYLTITWVGNNNGSPMNQSLVSGVTGAAPIWNDIMSYVLKGKDPLWQEKPSDVAQADVCVSGFPPASGDTCQTKGPELYWKKSQPSNSQYVVKNVWIKPDTGQPPKPGESSDGLVLQQKTVLTDPLTNEFCLDCTWPVSPDGKVQYGQETVNTDTTNDKTSNP